MKDIHLRFAQTAIANLHDWETWEGWYDNADRAIFDLLGGDAGDIPEEPGAYVLGAADGTMLVYPWGTSPIYYIGESGNLRERLMGRRTGTQRAVDDHDQWMYPIFNYGAAFGAHAVWYLAGEIEPKNVEATLINAFYETYGAIPTANHVWPNFKGKGD